VVFAKWLFLSFVLFDADVETVKGFIPVFLEAARRIAETEGDAKAHQTSGILDILRPHS
jgi:hypothetical protein